MKLVQLIRPLFLTAVGLHVLVLFVPIGPTEPEAAVIEDVAFEPLPDKPAEASSAASALPVPDPNVSTTTTAKAPAKAPDSRSATVVATPAPRPSAAATRAATPSNRTASRASTPNATATPSSPSSRQATSSNTPTAQSEPSRNFIAVLDEEAPDPDAERPGSQNSDRTSPSNSASGSPFSDSPSSDSSSSDSPSSGSGTNAPLILSALLSDVTQQMPDSLRAFADKLNRSLTYSAKDTDDESANQAREDWQENIQKQANIGQIERFPAAEITELTQIEYPIESSVEADGQLLNRCLEKAPHSAEIGVLFDAQGNIIDQPTVLRSTGYSALNEEIKAIVAAYEDFPSDRAAKAYAFEVDVFYDSEGCVSLDTLKDE
ncbi:MAG: hypothetical protein WA783_17690 [Phormidesmis sp.]